MSKVREAWLGIREGARDDSVRKALFVSRDDGRVGRLVECHITGEDSAHPGAWMFRLEGSLRWHWEMELAECVDEATTYVHGCN